MFSLSFHLLGDILLQYFVWLLNCFVNLKSCGERIASYENLWTICVLNAAIITISSPFGLNFVVKNRNICVFIMSICIPWHFHVGDRYDSLQLQNGFLENTETFLLCMDTCVSSWFSMSSFLVFGSVCAYPSDMPITLIVLLLIIGQYKIKYVPLAWTFWGEGVSNSLEASPKDPWFAYEPFSQRDNTSITSRDPYVDMDSSTCACICVMFFLFMTVGVPCLIVAGQCETAELRANNTALCWLIHSDESAGTLRTVGWVFSLPFTLTVLGAVCLCTAALCDWQNVSERD